MNICILLYSQTGNTLVLAEAAMKGLQDEGHNVVIKRIEADQNPRTGKLTFKTKPDITDYDAYILASPVQAFRLALPMKTFLKELPDLTGKKVSFMLTKHIPNMWTGGKAAIRTMKKEVTSKHGQPGSSGVIYWKKPDKEEMIAETVKTMVSDFIK